MRTVKIKDISKIVNGSTPSTSNEKFRNGDIVWITPKDLTNFTKRYIYNGHISITKDGYNSCSTQLVPSGTILLSSRAPIGYLAIAGKELCTNQGFKLIICNDSIVNNIYLYYWLSTKVEYLKSISSGATFKELSKDTLENVEINLPTLREQQHIVNTIGTIDDLIDNYNQQKDKICNILRKSLELYDDFVPLESYNPKIIKSGINKFETIKKYLDTSSIEGINNILNGEEISFSKRPSRANMQPIKNSIWFAKMKGSNKILILTEHDDDIIANDILSTGFFGIEVSDSLPLSLLTSIIISENFNKQRDLNSVGTTMAGINNETFLKIMVPYLNIDEINEYDSKYKSLVDNLSLLRRKINILNKEKSLLLSKYF